MCHNNGNNNNENIDKNYNMRLHLSKLSFHNERHAEQLSVLPGASDCQGLPAPYMVV